MKSELRRKLLQLRREFRDDESPKIVENFLKLPELESATDRSSESIIQNRREESK